MVSNVVGKVFMLVVALVVGTSLHWAGQPSANAQDGLTRTVISKKDLEADPKKELTIFIAEYKPGAKSGKHYHSGQEFIYVLEGRGVMDHTPSTLPSFVLLQRGCSSEMSSSALSALRSAGHSSNVKPVGVMLRTQGSIPLL